MPDHPGVTMPATEYVLACRECVKAAPAGAPYKVVAPEQGDPTALEQMRRHLVQRHAPKVSVAVKLEADGHHGWFGYPGPTVG